MPFARENVDTPMLVNEAEDNDVDIEEYLAKAAAEVPSGRIATPEDIAGIVLFLANNSASHINGAAIPVDGGGSA